MDIYYYYCLQLYIEMCKIKVIFIIINIIININY